MSKSTQVDRAIYFDCFKCEHGQYHEYTLENGWLDDRAVNSDVIDCEECGEPNNVHEEL